MARIDDIGTFHDSPPTGVVEWRLGETRTAEATLDQDAAGTTPQDFKGATEVGHEENHLAWIETKRMEGQPTELTVSKTRRAAPGLVCDDLGSERCRQPGPLRLHIAGWPPSREHQD